MKVVFDSSIWIEHLRRDVLTPVLPTLRGRVQLWMDSLVAAELIAGCRSARERKVVDALLRPFSGASRVQTATATITAEAGGALSRLRERGLTLANPAGALIDATIAATTARSGALFVTENARDFEKLSKVLAFRWEPLATFASRLSR